MISYFKLIPPPGEQEVILDVAKRQAWMHGEEIGKLNELIRDLYDYRTSTLTSNGFSTLFISLKALKLENQPILIPRSTTCFAISNAVLASGNIPIFYDLDIQSLTYDLTDVIRLAKNHACKYIIVVDHFGITNDLNELKQQNLFIIRDGAQAVLNNIHNTNKADLLLLSFYATKGLNGMDGGAILSDDDKFIEACDQLIYYDHQSAFSKAYSFNFRPNNLGCAMVLNAYKNRTGILQSLETLKAMYDKAFAGLDSIHLYGKTQTFLQRYAIRFLNDKVMAAMDELRKKQNIQIPKAMIDVADATAYPYSENSSQLVNTVYLLPYYYGFSSTDQLEVISAIKNEL